MRFPSPPGRSSHPVDVGQQTEAFVVAQLVRRGYCVLLPYGVNHRYDLAIDTGSELLRVQCKTGRLRKGRVVFATRSVRSNTRGSFTRSYKGEIDFFAVYCEALDRLYAVPVEVAPVGYCVLRVDHPANNQQVGIRWASDYEVPA